MTPQKAAASRIQVFGLDSRGRGLLDHQGRILAFDGLFPGDVAEVFEDCSRESLSYRLVSPSPNRIKPDCPFHGPCGGCDLLELSEKARIKAKSELFERTLRDVSPETKPRPFLSALVSVRYRPRMRLHQSRDRQMPDAGFLPSEKFSGKMPGGIVPVTSCLLLNKPLNKRLVALRRALSRLPFRFNGFFVLGSAVEEEKVAGHLVLAKGWTAKRVKEDMEAVARAGQLTGVSIGPEDGTVEGVVGKVEIPGLMAPEVEGGPYGAEPSIFVQGNVQQNIRLVQVVMEFCAASPGDLVVEGFAGAGNFTIPLARAGVLVEAFESHPGAVRMLKKNLMRAGLGSKVKISPVDAYKEIVNASKHPKVLLIDPPRTGLGNIAKVVKALAPESVVYVSCDLESLKRDAGSLLKAGYQIGDAVAIDLYPRTSHLESVIRFTRI